ncbi:MAG: PilZ domain-containing protein [Nitrospirae bacterium]|nr:PilZ domain-containing protein [Nitrospirota bacterium]
MSVNRDRHQEQTIDMERRGSKRVSVEKDVIINRIVRAYILDINEDGMYIYTQARFIPGVILQLNFSINGEPIEVMAQVKHAQPGIGIGVKFIEISEKDSTKIKKYIEEIS